MFVDDTGRRHRVVRVVGWVVGGLTLAYLTLLGVSLVGSPGLVPLSLPAIGNVLPGPSAPQIADATKVTHNPGELVPGDPRTTSVVGAVGVVGVDGVVTPAGGPQVAVTPAAVPATRHSRTPTAIKPTPTPTPSAAHTPQGNPSPAGSPRASHTPAGHPSPKNTHASPHNVKSSPTPSPT